MKFLIALFFFAVGLGAYHPSAPAKSVDSPKPKLTYIEELIEKEVDWPLQISLVEQLSPSEGPRLRVFIGVPELLRLRASDSSYEIKSTRDESSPFRKSPGIKTFISLDMNRRTALLKIEKLEKGAKPKPVALKISFPETPLFYFAPSCHRLYDLKEFKPTKPAPFITHMSCPSEEKISIKTTPEVSIARAKKQASYNLVEFSAKSVPPNSLIKISPPVTMEDVRGNLGLLLHSKADVLYDFEGLSHKKKSTSRPKRNPAAQGNEDIVGIHTAGFMLSEYDPEIFGSVDFKKEKWRSYFTAGGQLSLPFFFTGHSTKGPIDGTAYFLVNRPLTEANSPRRYAFGLGAEVLKRASPSYYAVGPRVQFSIEKLYSWSQRVHLGLSVAGASISKQIFKLKSFDQSYEAELRLTVIRPTGNYIEPTLAIESFDFNSSRQKTFTFLKIGIGARF